jgi:hypothetical protein
MADLIRNNPKFSTRSLLTVRSPSAFIHTLIDIALRLSALGLVDEAVDLLELADTYVPVPASHVSSTGLYFAFQTADWWPDFAPDEDMEDENLFRRLEVDTVNTSFGSWTLDQEKGEVELERDRRDLEKVVAFVGELGKGRGKGELVFGEEKEKERVDGDGEKKPISMWFNDAVFFGVHLALKLDDEEAAEKLFEVIRGDLEDFIPRLARYRFVWRVLVKGALGPKDEEGKKELLAEFERVKSAVRKRAKNGVEYPFLDEEMKDLVRMLDENTRRHIRFKIDIGSPSEDGKAPPNSIKPVKRPGATTKMIEDLEERLKVDLPDDYIDFLQISDGMEGIWNGYSLQRLLAPSSQVGFKIPTSGSQDPYMPPPPAPIRVLALIPSTDLPDGFGVVWPWLSVEEKERQLLVIGAEEWGRGGILGLVRGWAMMQARNRLLKRIKEIEEGEVKERRWVERVVGDYFGGMEDLEELDEAEEDDESWGVVYWDSTGLPIQVWGSFREWIENAVVESEFPDVVLERRDL